MHHGKRSIKLQDCRLHGAASGAELFLVEGDSAAHSVASQRNKLNQAVLPMQGKPMNAIKASESRVRQNPLFEALLQALGTNTGTNCSLSELRYERLVLLFDPDADGIHSSALMLMFLHRFVPQLLSAGRVLTVRAPLFRITSASPDHTVYAASEKHLEYIMKQLAERGIGNVQTLRYRGLGSLEQTLLKARCIDPQTRVADVMGERDAQMAIEIFGG